MKSQLNLNQIKAWTTCLSLHYWFLMGIEKVNNGQLSFNNFIDIASWIAGNLSRKETQSLFELHNAHIPEKLRDVSLAKIEKKHYSFWNKTKRYFSNEKKQEQCINFEKERNKIEERYQARKFSL